MKSLQSPHFHGPSSISSKILKQQGHLIKKYNCKVQCFYEFTFWGCKCVAQNDGMNVKDQLESMHVEETVSVYIEGIFKAKHQARSASINGTRNIGNLLNTEN